MSTGGTGLTGRDVTIEALRALFEKEIEGFGVAFHMVPSQDRSLDRAVAGDRRRRQGQVRLLPAGFARRLP